MVFTGGLIPFKLALIFVVIFDIVDIILAALLLTVVGTPFAFLANETIGQVLDGISILINFLTVGPVAIVGAIEFIPVIGDPLPIHTMALVFGKFGAPGSKR